MSNQKANEPMLEMYLFETSQLLEQLEQAIMINEKENSYTKEAINEIFRFMHTIKGSSGMMLFNDIAVLAHTVEDVFYFLREQNPKDVDYSTLSDLVLEAVDFIKVEIEKIKNGDEADGKATELTSKTKAFLSDISAENTCKLKEKKPKSEKQQRYYIAADKQKEDVSKNTFKATLFFEEGCEMENIRAYAVIHNLAEHAQELYYLPEDIIENDASREWVREKGFDVFLKTEFNYEQLHQFLMQTICLKELSLIQLENDDIFKQFYAPKADKVEHKTSKQQLSREAAHIDSHSIISVNVEKLDRLMDLVGEMVIAEAMVTQNPEVETLELENFKKAARQLHKITNELQDMVMAIRMVPLSTTFLKMQRIMRDMCKKLGKEVKLELIGEETEVDKNIIEHISDPLMHLIRNAIDHGIEEGEERIAKNKSKEGTVILEARNSGSDVLVLIKDDGKGLSKEKLLKKAKDNGLIEKGESQMTDKEIYSLILLPGFSTKENITEFSGRGVGMDVVKNNIEKIGGSVTVESILNRGTTIILKIPLTLAIIEGMNIKVGNSRYTIPIIAIKESFRPKENECFVDPDGNEMIMVRGVCYPILRLHKYYSVYTEVTLITEGILIMLEQNETTLCLFADELLGQQQVVVKALPNYIKSVKKIEGLAGCTLLGDGNISLILDVGGLSGANTT